MPNWVDCRVTITHTNPDKLDQLMLILSGDAPFQAIRPMPSLVSLDERYTGTMPEWHGWRCENWGTKWEPDILELERPDSLTIDCQMLTAWNPPIGIFDTIYDLGFRVEAVYLDELWCFAGHYCDKGDKTWQVDPRHLPEIIEEHFGDAIRACLEDSQP